MMDFYWISYGSQRSSFQYPQRQPSVNHPVILSPWFTLTLIPVHSMATYREPSFIYPLD